MEGQISVEYFNTIRETRYEREDLNLQALLPASCYQIIKECIATLLRKLWDTDKVEELLFLF